MLAVYKTNKFLEITLLVSSDKQAEIRYLWMNKSVMLNIKSWYAFFDRTDPSIEASISLYKTRQELWNWHDI